MSSIDVLLQAADFLERQQQFSSLSSGSSSYESSSSSSISGAGGQTISASRVVSLSPYFLASSSLSPPLSSASSTSSSCFGSPSGSRSSGSAPTDNNVADSSSPLEIKHFHKKFSPSKGGLDPQVLTSKFSYSSSQSSNNGNSNSSAAAAYHNVLYPSPSSSISSDCSNSGSGFGSSSSSGAKLHNHKLKTNSHSGIVNGGGAAASCSSSLDRMDDAKRDKALHNTLEKNRRAHLKDCFENLQNELPQYKDKKATNLAILNYTVKYIDACHRKNRDYEREKAMLLKRQNLLKQALEQLVTDIKTNDKDFDLKKWQATNATSYSGAANDLKSDYLTKVDVQLKSSSLSCVNGENETNFASDYLDDSTASTSTASANDYATIHNDQASRAKRNIIHNKSHQGASLFNKPVVSLKYQRKRSSNSLNLPSINIGNIHMNNNNKPPVIATKIIKLDEHHQMYSPSSSSSQQVKRMPLAGNHRQRHYSVDESMIKSKQQRKRQINVCDDITTEDDLLDEEEEDDEEFDYEYDDEDEEMVTSNGEEEEMYEDDDDSENELVINEDVAPTSSTTASINNAAAVTQHIVKLQAFSRSISNNSTNSCNESIRSSPSLDTAIGSIKSSPLNLNGNLENLKLVLNENLTRHKDSQKPILSLNASTNGGVGAQYIITSNQNNNTSNSVTGGGNKQIQIINKSTATTTTTGGSGNISSHPFNHPSLHVKQQHHQYAFSGSNSSNNTQLQNQHLTDSALKYQINVGRSKTATATD